MADLRRSKRQRQQKVFFDQRETYGKPPGQKKRQKKRVEALETRAAAEPPPPVVDKLLDQPIPQYSPPIQVPFEQMSILWIENDPFSLFIRFLGESSLLAIVDATNAKAASFVGPRQEFARTWTPLTRGELLCWLGLLFYMANHIQIRRHEYWSSSRRILNEFMGRSRWE